MISMSSEFITTLSSLSLVTSISMGILYHISLNMKICIFVISDLLCVTVQTALRTCEKDYRSQHKDLPH